MRDICMSYLIEAKKYESQMVELPLYQSIFEAVQGNPVAVAQEERNNVMGEKSASLLSRALNAIKNIYENIKQSISNIFNYLKLSKDEKEQYQDFARKCNEDPEFANQKVTVKNWKIIDKEYDDVISNIEKNIETVKRSEEEAKPTILSAIDNKIRGLDNTVKQVGIKITLDQLITRAKYDETVARALQTAVDNDFGALDMLSKQVGSWEVKKNKIKLKMINSHIGLLRRLAGVRKQKADIHAQAVAEEKAMIKTFIKSMIKGAVKYGNKDTMKATAKLGRNIIMGAHHETKAKKKQIKAIHKSKKQEEKYAEKDRIMREKEEAKRERRRQIDEEHAKNAKNKFGGMFNRK